MITTTISPLDIPLPKYGFSASKWQKRETENGAYFLLKMARKHKSWRDFTKAEIDEVAKENFWFNSLTGYYQDIIENWVYDVNTGKKVEIKNYSFTDSFILELVRLSERDKKLQNQ